MRLDILLFAICLVVCLAYLFVPSVKKSVFELFDAYALAPFFLLFDYFPYVLIVLLILGILGTVIFPPTMNSPIGLFLEKVIERAFITIGNLTFDVILFVIFLMVVLVAFVILDIGGLKPGIMDDYAMQGILTLMLFFATRILMFVLGVENVVKAEFLSGPKFGAG